MNTTGFTGKVVSVQELKWIGEKALLKLRFRVYQGKFKDKHKSIFLNAEVWGPHAEYVANNVAKDNVVGVSGRLDCDTYEKDGQPKEAWKIANAQVTLLDKGNTPSMGSEPNFEDDPFAD